MAKITIKEQATQISDELGIQYDAVVHMFELIAFNIDNDTQIVRDDLIKYSERWNMDVGVAANVLALCQLAAIDS